MGEQAKKWKTVSLPKALTDDIQELIDESGYWPSMGSFIREAALEKLHKERARGRGKIIPKPLVRIDKES